MHTIRRQDNYRTARLWLAVIAAFAMLIALVPQRAAAEQQPMGPPIEVIVREAPGAGDGPERLVERVGGTVGQSLELIGGFSASVPSNTIASLEASPEIVQITPNAVLELSEAGWEDASTLGSADPRTAPSSLYEVARYMRADEMWDAGYTGAGVDIALIDSGVVPVNGLTAPGKIFNGPDLSFESQYDSLRYLDTFGHGTHMAGIMAGLLGIGGGLVIVPALALLFARQGFPADTIMHFAVGTSLATIIPTSISSLLESMGNKVD